jgi:hypothetical protein
MSSQPEESPSRELASYFSDDRDTSKDAQESGLEGIANWLVTGYNRMEYIG